jgi:hypothetical protein
MVGSNRAVSIAGGLFVVAFTAGLAFLADELGAFADHDGTFVDHFSTGSQRGADIVGSILLAAAAVTFMYFSHLIASIRPDSDNKAATSDLVRMAGILTGVFMLVAVLALVTVPFSISLGEFFDEAGGAFGQGQAVLPQFGFVALVFGAMIPAAVTMVAVARLGLFPTWLARATIPVAVLLALTSGSVMTMVLLPIWVGLATVALAKAHRQNNG